ncbi:MAG: acyltransferase [Planctomycetota bacterium]|jgi:fucose 4-O-acetylase-like acetyltransferase
MSHYLKDRDPSFDAFRGIAIVAVVATHSIPWEFHRDYVVLLYRQVLNFAVPAFLFISGYWLSKKPIRSWEDYKNFLHKRFSRFLVPYLFWSFVYLGYEAAKTHDVNIVQILFKLLTGEASFPCNHLYFIIVIAQLYVLTPLLTYYNRKPYGFISVLMFNVVGLFVLYFFRLYGHWSCYEQHCLIHCPFYSWIISYQIGLLIGSSDNKEFIPRNIHNFILPAIFVSLAVSELEAITLSLKYDDWQAAACALKYSSFIYSTCIIFGFLVLRERFKNWPRFLVILGNYSFGIYLIHVLILRGVVKVMRKIDTLYSYQALYEFMVVLITLVICCVLITVVRKFLPKSFCSKLLGF